VATLGQTRNEVGRLAALRSYNILDTPPEPEYDAITALIAELCEVPIALVSLVDENRQWFKSNCGLTGVTGTSRDISFCTHALEHKGILEIPDTQLDPRFAENPLVLGPPHLRFYAGAPLADSNGMVLGTLCVADRVPRRLTLDQWSNLARLAISITNLIVSRNR
jgi:GAF domain-containing protein